MAKFAGPMIWSGKKCAFCGEEIAKGEYAIQEGFFHRRWYHNECWRKKQAGKASEKGGG